LDGKQVSWGLRANAVVKAECKRYAGNVIGYSSENACTRIGTIQEASIQEERNHAIGKEKRNNSSRGLKVGVSGRNITLGSA